jgi:hypothetical protein
VNLANKTLASLAHLLDSQSWHGDLIGNAILIHPLGIKVTSDLHQEAGQGDVRCVIITATHELFPDGVQDHAVGLGASDDEIAASAAETWFDQVFAAIHSFLCSRDHSDVQKMDLVTHDTASDKVFAWKLHMSAPSNYSMQGVVSDSPDKLEFAKSLLGPLSAVLLDRKVHTVKCFLGVLPNRSVHSESRLDGEIWDTGTQLLEECAKRWLDERHFEIRKQFLLFAPCELSDLTNGLALAADARAQGARPMNA